MSVPLPSGADNLRRLLAQPSNGVSPSRVLMMTADQKRLARQNRHRARRLRQSHPLLSERSADLNAEFLWLTLRGTRIDGIHNHRLFLDVLWSLWKEPATTTPPIPGSSVF